MNAHSSVNLRVLFGQCDCSFKGAAVRIAGADVEHRYHAGFTRVSDYRFTIIVVLRAVDVAMGIDEHDSTLQSYDETRKRPGPRETSSGNRSEVDVFSRNQRRGVTQTGTNVFSIKCPGSSLL